MLPGMMAAEAKNCWGLRGHWDKKIMLVLNKIWALQVGVRDLQALGMRDKVRLLHTVK
jgi:hypothetical protein